jgi:diketogulonate reductase-like aldo/keto reductase
MALPAIQLSNNTQMPSVIVGTFQHRDYSLLKTIVGVSLRNGFAGFDTAPSYQNEAVLGKVLSECMAELSVERKNIYLIDKIDGWQMQQTKGNVEAFVDDALHKLRTDYVDLLLIHWPFPDFFLKTWECFVDLCGRGKARSIGVCNVRNRHLSQLINESGFKPHAVQIERHPLRTAEDILQFNKENGIVTQAYSPVCRMMPDLADSDILNRLSDKYSRSKGQIIMRWHIDTGSVPVFMTQKAGRIKEYAELFDFHLEAQDIHCISGMNADYKLFLESTACPGF